MSIIWKMSGMIGKLKQSQRRYVVTPTIHVYANLFYFFCDRGLLMQSTIIECMIVGDQTGRAIMEIVITVII